ncbi:MAG TPA: penicillin-binding protein activator [Burkholderiaceae bacterium]
MLNKLVKLFLLVGMLAYLLSGLCASAQTNTTMPSTAGSVNPATKDDTQPIPPTRPQIRMALLLPLNSPALASAAEAVRAGFFAAYERDGADVKIRIFPSGEQPKDVLQAYADAAYEYDYVIGPLSRDDVAAVVQNEKISKPTIALAQLDNEASDEVILPQKMLMMGFSIEDEARQIANWASTGKKSSHAFIVSTDTAWQHRAATAFTEEWQRHGLTQQLIEIPDVEGYLSASSMEKLKTRIQTEKPALLFAALDAQQASQLRMVIGNDVPMYGTSQLNALTLSEQQTATPMPEMNNVHLVDIPWQLEPDHLAVMSYPPLPTKENQQRRADLQRLYALGIDAYRVAKEIATQHSDFTIDGVTGALTISFGKGTPSFKRVEQQAIYRKGSLVPVDTAK